MKRFLFLASTVFILLIISLSFSSLASSQKEQPKRNADYSQYDWKHKVKKAKQYAAQRQGQISFGILDENKKLHGRHLNRVHYSASTVKVMMMVIWLRHIEGSLTQADKNLLRPMITRSKDEPANYIYSKLGPDNLYRLARDAKMKDFKTGSVWGHSHITVRDQSAFMWRLKKYIPPRYRDYAFRLLNNITPSQRWGAFKSEPKGWKVYAKGGFVNPGSWRINQVVQLKRGNRKLAVVVLTENNPSLNYGAKTIEGITSRLLNHYNKRVK